MAGQKSFRRKYNKIRHQFKGIYESNILLHEEESQLAKVARRLQEQNDQLLEILIDLNESGRIAKHLHYALEASAESDVPDLQAEEEISQEKADEMLEYARDQLNSGEMMQRDYDIMVGEIKSSLKKPSKMMPLPQMERTISHTSLSLMKEDQIPGDIKEEEFSTYLDAAHEDAYLAQLDATIDGVPLNGDTQPSKTILLEATFKNPVSTYNWLREHKPEVFVQEGGADKDKSDEKETKGGSSTPAAVKRESRAIKRPSIVELLDDEGNLVGNYTESGPPSKSKRKREDDAYRPKGGGSSSKKRKKSTAKAPDAE